ncbi:sporulation protein YpjB [Priestia sp. JV24]|uniref:sporulation protein YpjB n=1 Tax=Priestia TaxID=2800373 RepID=UPI0021D67871|nr:MULTISPECIES: sporulation protein YpjB [Priestia]MCU7709919.1 sporulation protein YpjB [Priestia megaterium]MCW1044751.1 sporulation protein YpjB [Priestia sp. JV24]
MKGRIVGILLVLFFAYTTTVHAAEGQWEKLDNLSDQTLSLVEQKEYKAAQHLFRNFSNEFTSLNTASLGVSAEDIRILTLCYEQVERSLLSSDSSDEERLQKATQFRLLVDALHSKHQPMWTELEGSMLATFKEMRNEAVKGEQSAYEAQLKQFLKEYDMILPSAQVDVSFPYVQRVSADVHFLQTEGTLSEINDEQFNQMEQNLKDFFEQVKENRTDPSFIWVTITTGSIIIATLFYVGARKYFADQKRKSARGRND